MKKKIKHFIASAVCEGIEQYVKKHRFGMYGMIEMIPFTHEEFEKHLFNNVFQKQEDSVKNYLSRTIPTTEPQLEHITK